MENASKALIIAGAILVSILLISIGVVIINAMDPEDSTRQMQSMEIRNFNSQFTIYEGEAVSASQVKTLVSAIRASNATNGATTAEDEKYVAIEYTSPLTASGIKSTRKYVVTIGYNDVTGYVNKVTIANQASE